jgi:hypothetical protein
VATKLMPLSYQIRTWLAYAGGLAMDLARFRIHNISDRINVLRDHLQYLVPVLRERQMIFGYGGVPASEQLERLLNLSNVTQ